MKHSILYRRGFSLTEMAVVIASVAAIVVMATTGINIVNQAHVNRTTQDINGFTAAMESFEELYGALPGDIADVSALPAGETGGNGDGTIDTASEALNFWRHLSRTGMLSGDYDGSSTYVPGDGVPPGSTTASGYNVFNPTTDTTDTLYDQAIIFEFAAFSSTSNQLPALRASDARNIDKNGDDGNPSTGIIRGAGESCIDDNSTANNPQDDRYNVDENSINCRLLFIIRQPAVTKIATSIDGECLEVGTYRKSTSEVCPTGTTGSVMERCNSSGSWEIATRDCETIKCPGDKIIGSTRILSCLEGQTGEILQTCQNSGVWKDTSNSCTANSDSCTTNGEVRQIPCIRGESGYIEQECTSGQWQESNNTCVAIGCSGGGALNDTRASSTTVCNSNNAKYNTTNSNSVVTEMCSIDGQWHIIYNNCLPLFGGCTAGDTRDILCPPGEHGQHRQKCVANSNVAGNYWVTTSDTCKPVKCGGHPLGYQRSAKTTCPNNAIGVVTEICTANYNATRSRWEAAWTATNNMCADAYSN